jgi:murein DD-endopeptidase MepM/ murein hydrolase activator NlpD
MIVRMRKLIVAVLVLVLAAIGIFIAAGYSAGPSLEVVAPVKYVGLSTPLEVVVRTPGGRLSSMRIEFEQGSTRTPLFVFEGKGSLTGDPHVTMEGPDTLHVKTTVGRESVKGLKSGQGRIVVTAVRPVVFGIRRIEAGAARDVEVRLERPKVSVLSTHHYINAGGSEMIVYRATPEGVASGVAVGNVEYPGYPASRLPVEGVSISDAAVHVAFFALRYDQNVNAPMHLFARDEAGNVATAEFDHRTFPKQFKSSRIPLEDKFLDRVVPAILDGTTEVKAAGSTIDSFLVINRELRRKNGEKIVSFAAQTAPEMLWRGVVFHQFSNTAVESAFADRRTYTYQGREVDRQTHLGFDLASVANTPIVAANRGRVVYADNLGIYGNCVIIDHGMGVQSLYAHLSSIDVKPGAMVEKEAPLGRSGMTGLAGGDHLHFTMLVNGHMVNPIEWWDPHWIEDRVLRKLREAK